MKTKTTITTWARVLVLLTKGQSEAAKNNIILRLQEQLKRKKKDYLLPKILETAEKYLAQAEKITLVLARETDSATKDMLGKKLIASLGEGKKIELRIDDSIIGGFVARTEDYLIDASVKKYLNQLKRISLEEI
ncbi:MAG: F0F1 ATP synthase subunit delta [Candidatus Nealsonbacteria bacterium]|nr:F0F1 ATP synthase subunit delta [Candidatus Nealsonbacteria bacterium]